MQYAYEWADAEWTEDGKPMRFATEEEANAAIEDFLDDAVDSYLKGYLDEPYYREEFRVVPVDSADIVVEQIIDGYKSAISSGQLPKVY